MLKYLFNLFEFWIGYVKLLEILFSFNSFGLELKDKIFNIFFLIFNEIYFDFENLRNRINIL